MKKVLLTKTLVTTKTESPAMVVVKHEPVDGTEQHTPSTTSGVYQDDTYQRRKSMKVEFSDLFQALLRIPDKQIQQRVLAAINNDNESSEKCELCPRCKLQRKRTMKDACTQVDGVATTVQTKLIASVRSTPISMWPANSAASSAIDQLKVPSSQTTEVVPSSQTTEVVPSSQTTEVVPELSNTSTEAASSTLVRKKRKRKICIPQVIKKSHAQRAQNHMQPKMMRFKAPEEISCAKKRMSSPALSVCSQADSLGSLNFLDILGEASLDEISPLKHDLVSIMANECLRSEQLKDGLLPIHDAVIENEYFVLRRQIYIWKIWKKVDINELLTDDNDDCVQLAVVNNCSTRTIEILLDAGMNANCIDGYSNNVIHLAIINEITVESLRVLMWRIDLKILLRLNDDGYTPLHLAVRQDCYIHAEVIMNVLDERLESTKLCQSTSVPSKQNFLKFYEDICKDIERKKRTFQKFNSLKKQLLEAGDLRGGNTALFFALENQLEHFVYFLLAHQTDPRIPNHSGQNACGFYSEFGKILNLNLRIDRIMDIVIEQS